MNPEKNHAMLPEMPRLTALFSLMLILLAACGSEVSPLPQGGTGCESGWAIVMIGDGYLQPLCGCQETPEAVSSGVFSCTVAAGTAVFFRTEGRFDRHQILSTGAPSFVSSRVLKSRSVSSHTAVFPSPGIYAFQDPYLPGILGKIVAL